MRSEIEIRPATLEHVDALAAGMRVVDKEEIWAATHERPYEALLFSLKVSRDPQMGFIGDRPICVFGIGSAMICSTLGVPWFLATDELKWNSRSFLQKSEKALAKQASGYERLENYVDARNTASIRYLKWLGFNVLPAEPFGAEQLPFHPFTMRA